MSQESGTTGPRLVVTFGDHDTGRRDFMSYFDQRVDATTGLSVNLANGNFNLSTTDLAAPGVGLDFALERNWSSLRWYNEREFGDTAWQFSASQGRIYPAYENATVYLPGSSPIVFSKLGGQYAPPPGANATLTTSGSGTSQLWTLKFNRTGDVWTFKTLANGNAYLWRQADRNGNAITYTYDTSAAIGNDGWARLTSITDTFGQVTNLTYTGDVVTKATDWAGRDVDYLYSARRLVGFDDANGNGHSYGFDSGWMLRNITTGGGRDIKVSYDSNERASEVTWVTTSATDVDPTWAFSYTALANGTGTTTMTDPNGNATVYTWDPTGRIIKTKDALGHEHQGTWSANSDPLTSITATGATTAATYDSFNNLTNIQGPDVDATTQGRSTALAYTNSTHPYQPTSVTDTEGRTRSFLYDTPGNATSSSQTGWPGNVDASLTYNANGTIATATDAKANVSTYTYDTAGRLTGIDHPGPLGSEAFTYDTVGRVRTHTDGKAQTTTLSYNAKNQVTASQAHGGATVSYTYDGDGALTGRVDAIGTWGFAYDELGRNTTKNIPGGSSNSATYDAAGNVKTYTDANGTVTYGYDAANNLTSLAEPGGSCTGTITKCTTFGYDANGKRTSTTYPNGVVQTVIYDSSGRVQYLETKKNGVYLVDYAYRYTDPNGNDSGVVQYVTDYIAETYTKFNYDNFGHLEETKVYDFDDQWIDGSYYGWDAGSNRIEAWDNGSSTRHSTYNAADQLIDVDDWMHPTYDANGSMTATDQGFSASYNDRNQATSIGGVTQSYADVGQSERVTSGNKTLRTRLIGGIADETSGGVTTSYVRDPYGNLISQTKGGVTHYYLFDKLGSVVALTDSTGAVVQRFAYGNFGELKTTNIGVDSSFKYAGGYHDSATGLYKFGERYYDPDTATWTQRDTIAGTITDPKTMNRYVYVGGDPVNYVDPSGRIKSCAKAAVAGGVGGAAAGAATGIATTALTGGPGALTIPQQVGVGAFAGATGATVTCAAGNILDLF